MTQLERIRRAGRAAAQRGITQLDFDAPTIDGGPPIRRVASRVADARRLFGDRIDSRGRRSRMAVYVWVADPAPSTGVATNGPQETREAPLFPAEARPLSPYDVRGGGA